MNLHEPLYPATHGARPRYRATGEIRVPTPGEWILVGDRPEPDGLLAVQASPDHDRPAKILERLSDEVLDANGAIPSPPFTVLNVSSKMVFGTHHPTGGCLSVDALGRFVLYAENAFQHNPGILNIRLIGTNGLGQNPIAVAEAGRDPEGDGVIWCLLCPAR